jgi:predicted phage-related endonuclease
VAQAAQRRDLSQAERLLALRLAQIDHLRDVALQNGNAELMQQADKLEELARAQFDRRRNDDPTEPVSPPSDAPETPEP